MATKTDEKAIPKKTVREVLKLKSVGMSKADLNQRVQVLLKDRVNIGVRLVDLIEKANRLAEAHMECKDQLRSAEIDLVACGKEIRTVRKEAEQAL